jgi:tetratricopeptide (TPR) repeat protein
MKSRIPLAPGRQNRKMQRSLLIFLAAVFLTALRGAASAQDISSSKLLYYGEKNYEKKQYVLAIKTLEMCVSLYENMAMAEQKNSPGGVDDGVWTSPLNDVGSAHYLLMKIYLEKGKKDKAMHHYREIEEKFNHAQYWDEADEKCFEVVELARKLKKEYSLDVETEKNRKGEEK